MLQIKRSRSYQISGRDKGFSWYRGVFRSCKTLHLVKKAPQLARQMTSKKYDIWRQSLTVATVVTVEQLSRVENYGLRSLIKDLPRSAEK
jgi:hypothetical protein